MIKQFEPSFIICFHVKINPKIEIIINELDFLINHPNKKFYSSYMLEFNLSRFDFWKR